MKDRKHTEFDAWVSKLPKHSIDIWRESLASLRQLHADVWNGVRLFLGVNGVIIAAGFTIIRSTATSVTIAEALALLAAIGLAFTYVARRIFSSQRENYLDMMIRKTMIEKHLGFYDVTLAGVDLSFPWKVDKQYLSGLESDPIKWRTEQRRRKGSISRLLYVVFDTMQFIYAIGLISIVIWYFSLFRSGGHCG